MRGVRRKPEPALAGAASAAAAVVEPPNDTPVDPAAAAFFDVDNTVVRGALLFHLARGLYARKFFSNRDIARWTWQQAKFRLVGNEDLDHVAESRESALAFIRGRSVEELAGIFEEIYE